MDPNRTLADLRDWADSPCPENGTERATDLFLALDRWLSSGGFLPTAWELPHPNKAIAEAQAALAEAIQALSSLTQDAPSEPQKPAQGLRPNNLTPNYPLDPPKPPKAPR